LSWPYFWVPVAKSHLHLSEIEMLAGNEFRLRRVVAKSAQLRFRLGRKLRPLPCSSFPKRTRFAGLRFGWDAAKRL
jgi:hypothetical protein